MATEQDWAAYSDQAHLKTTDTLLARTSAGAGVEVPGSHVLARRSDGGSFEAALGTAGDPSVVTNISGLPGQIFHGGIGDSGHSSVTFESAGGGGAALTFGRDGSLGTFIDFFTNPSSSGSAGSTMHRGRIDQNGAMIVGAASTSYSEAFGVYRNAANPLAVFIQQTTSDTPNLYCQHARAAGGTFAYQIIFGNGAGAGVGSISSNGTTTSFNTTSDRRLKDNIEPAEPAGAILDAIEIVQHDWKDGGHVDFGVIAQDLHEVFPSAVMPGDGGEDIETSWGVDYSKLVPLMLAEIQALRSRVAALEAVNA